MKKIFMISIIAFSSLIGVFAGFEDKEIKVLREQINISDKEIIRKNKNEKLPSGQSIKVFPAVKYSKSSRRYFEKWVEKWNEDEAKKYGKLEIVDDLEKADVVITQFVTERTKYVEQSAVSVGTVPEDGEIVPKLRVKTERGYKPLILPVYSYLIVRSNDMWVIVYNDVESSTDGDRLHNVDARLWSALEKKLKNR